MYRRKLTHSRVKNLYKFSSPKNRSVLTVESSLEFDACFRLEYSQNIISYEAQPLGFHYSLDSKTLPYTPDFFLVEASGSSKYIEVKPSKFLDKDDFMLRFSARKDAAKDLGLSLELVTERQIRVSPLLDNLKLLHRYSGFSELNAVHFAIRDLVKKSGMVKVRDIVTEDMAEEGNVQAGLLILLQRGLIKADLDVQEFCENTNVWSS